MDVGKDGDGKRRQKLRSGFTTKREAERALHELQSELHGLAYVQPSRLTVSDFLLDEWLPATAPPRVRHETWQDRRRNLTNHVIPRIGGVRLQELNATHLNRMYADLLADGRLAENGGLSPTTVRRIHAMLRKALRDAQRWGRAQNNASDLADPPSAKIVKASRRRSMRVWNRDDLRTFLDATAAHRLGDLWLFAAATGVRRSELLGLGWNDVHLSERTATIAQTVIDGPDGFRLERDQKTAASGRTVHLSTRTVEMLTKRLRTQAAERERLGPAWHEHDLVFPQADGKWWNPPAISLAFGRAVKQAPVPPIRLHDLRHTHASLLLSAGVNPKVVSERLGHSSVAFTLDTYAHVMPGMQPEAAQRFDGLIFEVAPEDMGDSG